MRTGQTQRPRWTPMTDAERLARIERYQRARDRAVLRAPEAVRARFAEAQMAAARAAGVRQVVILGAGLLWYAMSGRHRIGTLASLQVM